jgi:N-acetyl sugar amidotransferase
MYPENTQPHILFDDDGICSGCRVHESRKKINWEDRKEQLAELLEEYKEKARGQEAAYDCIIPVSGGKDSHFQTDLIKNEYGLDPLLVTYNHAFNTRIGMRNLRNLVEKFGCDLIRYTSNPESIRRIAQYMVRKTGDFTWHYHSGITTFPIQAAVKYEIPLIIWGEEGYRDKAGMYNVDDMVEFTQKQRQEHEMRGFEPQDVLDDPESEKWGITRTDLAPFVYPSDSAIEQVGVRGLYLDNYISWDSHLQTVDMINRFDFGTYPLGCHQSGRTFLNYSEIDDATNGVHDYMKFLKFGYGRATDHVSREIRHGRMTREEGIELVKRYDPQRPKDFEFVLDFLDMSEQEFLESIEHLRDSRIWEQDEDGKWYRKDSVENHVEEPGVDAAQLSERSDAHWTDIANPIEDYGDREFITL